MQVAGFSLILYVSCEMGHLACCAKAMLDAIPISNPMVYYSTLDHFDAAQFFLQVPLYHVVDGTQNVTSNVQLSIRNPCLDSPSDMAV